MVTDLTHKRKMIIFAGILMGMFLSALDSTIISTAMPKIMSSLGGVELYSWTFTAYMLCSTMSVLIFGKLADMYGRKPFYLAGIIIFLIASALCGTSETMLQLVIYRGLQGIGGGIMMANSMTIIADIFSPAERGKYQGIMGGVFGLSSIIGPALGGYITDNLNWRWVFYVNVPVGIIALVILFIGLPSYKNKVKQKIDYSGIALAILAFTPMLLGFSWGGSKYEWTSPEILGLFGFSIVALIAFLLVEKKAQEPIVPLSLFKNRIFTVSLLGGFFMSIAMFGTVMYIPLFVQGVVGSSATNSGFITMPMMLASVVASAISGMLISKTGKYKTLAITGFAFIVVSTFLLAQMTVDSTNTTVVVNMIFMGIGLGLTMPIFTIAVQNAFPHSQVGTVTASTTFFRNIGGTMGVAVLGSFLNSTFKKESTSVVPEEVKQSLPAEAQTMFDTPQSLFDPNTISNMSKYLPAEAVDMFAKLIGDLKGVLVLSLHNVFMISLIFAVMGLISMFFLKELPLRKSNKDEEVKPEEELAK